MLALALLAYAAERMEDELGQEQVMFVESYPSERAELPMPDEPLTVGIDGDFVHAQGETTLSRFFYEDPLHHSGFSE